MDATCISQARRGWALSQLSGTASSWQYPSYPTCHSRAGFSIGHNEVFNKKSACHRFWISSQESQFLGDEMVSKRQTGVLGATFRPPSLCAHLPQDQKPVSDLHYPDLPTLNHQCSRVPTEPKWGTPAARQEIIRSIVKFCGTWKWGSWLKDPICFSEGSREDLAVSLLL